MPSSQKLTNMIKAKNECSLDVLYNLKVFCSDMKFKMAATAGLSLTLDPMGKMFQNASSLKPLGQLKPNCPGMIIGRSSTNFLFFMPIGNPRWPPPQHKLILDPMGKCSNAFFSETTNMSLEGPLQSFCFLCRSEIQDGHHRRT